jgi:hypothetical protein
MQLNLSNVGTWAVGYAAALFNQQRPPAAEGQQPPPPLSPEDYMTQVVVASWVAMYAVIDGQDFILRFTSAEFGAVLELSKTDTAVKGFVDRTRERKPIPLYTPDFAGALQYLVSKGCITADRVAALAALPPLPALPQPPAPAPAP